MRAFLHSRVLVVHVILAGAIACAPDERDGPAGDTLAARDSAPGVVDTAPATTATAVAALLTDENVFALLDTSLASMLRASRLAQSKATNTSVKELASSTLTDLAVTRRAITTTVERLNVAPVLPEREIVNEHRQALAALNARSGAEFDRAYLDFELAVREDLIEEIDDALKGEVRRDAVRTLLEQTRAHLQSGRAEAEQLKARL
jgi:predicted outer membrane protein